MTSLARRYNRHAPSLEAVLRAPGARQLEAIDRAHPRREVLKHLPRESRLARIARRVALLQAQLAFGDWLKSMEIVFSEEDPR